MIKKILIGLLIAGLFVSVTANFYMYYKLKDANMLGANSQLNSANPIGSGTAGKVIDISSSSITLNDGTKDFIVKINDKTKFSKSLNDPFEIKKNPSSIDEIKKDVVVSVNFATDSTDNNLFANEIEILINNTINGNVVSINANEITIKSKVDNKDVVISLDSNTNYYKQEIPQPNTDKSQPPAIEKPAKISIGEIKPDQDAVVFLTSSNDANPKTASSVLYMFK